MTIGDFVWLDTNANGVQDSGEPGIANVPVNLLLNSAVVATVTTNSTGHFEFKEVSIEFDFVVFIMF